MCKFVRILCIVSIQVINKDSILCIPKDQLMLLAEEGSYWVFFEFDTFRNLVGCPVDLIENISTDYCVYGFLLTLMKTIHRSTRFVNIFRLSCAHVPSSDGPIIGSTHENVCINIKITHSFAMPRKLIQNLALVRKTPFNDSSILKTTKHCLLSEACRHNFISYLGFLFLFFFLLFALSLKNSLFLFLFFSL